MWRVAVPLRQRLLPARAVELTGRVCRTHKTSQTAFRGFGGPQGMLVIEEILVAGGAPAVDLPADVVRERNFYREGDTTHYGQPVEDAERIATHLEPAEGDRARSIARRAEIDRVQRASIHTPSAASPSRR